MVRFQMRIKFVPEHAEFDESNANVLERFYTSSGNLVKEILLKLNLPDHRILKDGGEGKKKKRKEKNSEPSKDKVQTGSSSKGKTQSNPLSTDKHVKVEEPLHETDMDMEESIRDDVVNEADEVFSTWMAFGGNTRDLGSFREETDEITYLHQILKEVLLTARGDGVTSMTPS
ncbi:hypothetical protein Tco_0455007 [Tanacetum coccineum]